ncbi:MAG: tRNA (adenosine(37)-N6)-dimethylallyltransferase MiaA [Actinomycetota bacterium]|nr:tRNA (adenosine(37)-N6)-dimethylallyltransferase MiaA [Actinomycetota bacterium]MDA3015757.1 tRNA (adenosine(37)-N6)-dimethylallyltransferase MiaA [Actinomycetota bacterium]
MFRLAIIGPTASGKSSLAMSIASEHGDVDIVSVDSMQVYRGMDIGTAKPSMDERRRVPHHLIDLVEVDTEFTVATYVDSLETCLTAIKASGRHALFVGGTGLYLRAVVDGLELAGAWPDVRTRLEAEVATTGSRALHERLSRLDPQAASRIEPDNARRIVRALEVIEGSGRLFSDHGAGLDQYPETEVIQVGLRWPRSVLAERIGRRVETMINDGLVAEVERVLGSNPSRTARQALGYREIIEHLEGRCSLDEAVAETITRTRQFAVRQERWFRRDPRIVWVDVESDPVVEAGPVVTSLLP